jgi:SOS-response transcriptional repressor LexA
MVSIYRQNPFPIRQKAVAPVASDWIAPAHVLLYEWLVECAESNQVAPANAAICERFGWFSTKLAGRQIDKLVEAGAIEVFTRGTRRTVIICASGKHTAIPKTNAQPILDWINAWRTEHGFGNAA